MRVCVCIVREGIWKSATLAVVGSAEDCIVTVITRSQIGMDGPTVCPFQPYLLYHYAKV